MHRQRIDDAAAILDHDIVDELDVAELGIDRHVRGMRAVGVGVLLVEEGAFGRDAFGRKPLQRDRLAAGPDRLGAFDDLDLGGRAAEPLGGLCTDRVAQVRCRRQHRRAAHHHRARVIGAVAVADEGGGAVKDPADAVHRNLERVGGDLRERGFEPLADGGRPDIDRVESVRLEHRCGRFPSVPRRRPR